MEKLEKNMEELDLDLEKYTVVNEHFLVDHTELKTILKKLERRGYHNYVMLMASLLLTERKAIFSYDGPGIVNCTVGNCKISIKEYKGEPDMIEITKEAIDAMCHMLIDEN